MKRHLRAAAAAATVLAAPPAPAHAATADVMVCTIVYSWYGVGPEPGNGDCTAVTGPYATAAFRLDFTFVSDAAACPVAETAAGMLTGAGGLAEPFVWTKVLGGGLMTYQATGTTGPGTWVVTWPAGNPCGMADVRMTAVLPLP